LRRSLATVVDRDVAEQLAVRNIEAEKTQLVYSMLPQSQRTRKDRGQDLNLNRLTLVLLDALQRLEP